MGVIPVTFEFEGKTYTGNFSQVSGAGVTASYLLMVDNGYWGTLAYMEGHPGFGDGLHAVPSGWRFSSPSKPQLADLTDHFGYIIQQWMDCHY